jgi:hypothetical protein
LYTAAQRMVTKAVTTAPSIRDYRLLFNSSGNPIHAYAAYLEARRTGVAVPAWVLAHLDECLAALTAGSDSPRAVARAMGLLSNGGRGSVARRAATHVRDL